MELSPSIQYTIMNIFRVAPVEGSQFFQANVPNGGEFVSSQINGEKRINGWVPLPIRIVKETDRGRPRRPVDSCLLEMLPSAIALKRGVIPRLEGLLLPHGELLAAFGEGVDAVVFNVTKVVDALDERRSEIFRSAQGRILDISKFYLKRSAIVGIEIFKVPNLRVCPVLFTENAVKSWERLRVTGLEFVQVGNAT
jgi:hypothetical protein